VSYATQYFIETGQAESPQKNTIEEIRKVMGDRPKDVQTKVVESAEGGSANFKDRAQLRNKKRISTKIHQVYTSSTTS